MPSSSQAAPRRLIILGSTGSIGVNTLAVVEHLHAKTSHRFEIVGLATGNKVEVIAKQAAAFGVSAVAVAKPGELGGLSSVERLFRGPRAAEELIDAVAQPGDLIVGAMVGSAGLPAVIAAIRRGCDVALANKETLVAAGSIVMPLVKARGVNLIPIDSEHSAIFQRLLAGRSVDEVRRVVLTASGGPFRGWTKTRMERATVEEALKHPTWNMGAKVTIDSATLMNKALEVIEAHHLFGLGADRIDAIIHPQSTVHSFVEFRDGSVFAQLSPPDMKSPIQYALTWPGRAEGCSNRLDWASFRSLQFEPIDHECFPSIRLAWDAVTRGGTAGTILNAANEVAVAAFLEKRVPFGRLFEIVAETVESVLPSAIRDLDDVFAADRIARDAAAGMVAHPVASGL